MGIKLDLRQINRSLRLGLGSCQIAMESGRIHLPNVRRQIGHTYDAMGPDTASDITAEPDGDGGMSWTPLMKTGP